MSSFSLPLRDFRTKIIISLRKVYSFRGLHAFKLRKQLSERSIRYSRVSFSFRNPSPFSFNFFILGPANKLSRGISPTMTIQNDRRILFNDTRTQKITIEKFFFIQRKKEITRVGPFVYADQKLEQAVRIIGNALLLHFYIVCR